MRFIPFNGTIIYLLCHQYSTDGRWQSMIVLDFRFSSHAPKSSLCGVSLVAINKGTGRYELGIA